jgi:chaperonin GroEL
MAGDGTTTATVLARALFQKGMMKIDQGINAMDLRKGMNIALK